MKTHPLSRFLFAVAAALGFAAATRAADAPATSSAPGSARELALVVVEGPTRSSSAITYFDRMDMAMRDVVKERDWPVKLTSERLAANTPNHPTELRVFVQRIREEGPGDRTFRASMTMKVDGQEHDLGVVTYRYVPRASQNYEDTIQSVFLGAANEAADKIEPLLFPNGLGKKS